MTIHPSPLGDLPYLFLTVYPNELPNFAVNLGASCLSISEFPRRKSFCSDQLSQRGPEIVPSANRSDINPR